VRDRPQIPRPTGRRAAFLDGYSLHADRLVDEADREGLERLCRYDARSPVANARLSLDPSGRVVLSLKRPLHDDGRTEIAFTPIDFLRRLATLISPPRSHLTRYHGVFAPNHHLRAAIVPAGATAATTTPPCSASRCRLDWASLLKRVVAADVLVCDSCGGAMRILAVLPKGDASRAILEHLGLPIDPPPPAAVGPPEQRFDDV
jgi:Putative transposase